MRTSFEGWGAADAAWPRGFERVEGNGNDVLADAVGFENRPAECAEAFDQPDGEGRRAADQEAQFAAHHASQGGQGSLGERMEQAEVQRRFGTEAMGLGDPFFDGPGGAQPYPDGSGLCVDAVEHAGMEFLEEPRHRYEEAGLYFRQPLHDLFGPLDEMRLGAEKDGAQVENALEHARRREPADHAIADAYRRETVAGDAAGQQDLGMGIGDALGFAGAARGEDDGCDIRRQRGGGCRCGERCMERTERMRARRGIRCCDDPYGEARVECVEPVELGRIGGDDDAGPGDRQDVFEVA